MTWFSTVGVVSVVGLDGGRQDGSTNIEGRSSDSPGVRFLGLFCLFASHSARNTPARPLKCLSRDLLVAPLPWSDGGQAPVPLPLAALAALGCMWMELDVYAFYYPYKPVTSALAQLRAQASDTVAPRPSSVFFIFSASSLGTFSLSVWGTDSTNFLAWGSQLWYHGTGAEAAGAAWRRDGASHAWLDNS